MRNTPEEHKQLAKYIGYRSAVTVPEYADDVRQCAEWLAEVMLSWGFQDAIVLNQSGAFGSVFASYQVSPDLPTILFYGHYDVQPEGDRAKWQSDPYHLTYKDGLMYGRGIADNKGQNFSMLLGLKECIASSALRFNIKVILEGEEEIGSKNFEAITTQHKDLLSADYVLGIDGSSLSPEAYTTFYSTKGLTYYDLRLKSDEREFHSGYYGEMARNISDVTADFVIAIRKAFNDINHPTPDSYSKSAFRKAYKWIDSFIQTVGKGNLFPGTKTQILENNVFKSSLDVHSIQIGNVQELKTAIPNTATLRFSIRVTPEHSISQMDKFVQDFVSKYCKKHHLQFTMEKIAHADPTMGDLKSGFGKEIIDAFKKDSSNFVLEHRFTATLPVASILHKVLGKPFFLVGFSLPSSNIHAVNENLPLSQFEKVQTFIKNLVLG